MGKNFFTDSENMILAATLPEGEYQRVWDKRKSDLIQGKLIDKGMIKKRFEEILQLQNLPLHSSIFERKEIKDYIVYNKMIIYQ